jgi:hypothetical protein
MFPLKFIVFLYPKLIQASPQLNLKHYVMTPFSFPKFDHLPIKRSSVTGPTTGYDRGNLFRLKEITSAPSQSGSIRFEQQFNSLNRVTARLENDGTHGVTAMMIWVS